MSLRDLTQVSASIPNDFLATLGPKGVNLLLELMRDGYFDLRQKQKITLSMSENDITEELFISITQCWRYSRVPCSIIPVHEKQDKNRAAKRGKPPTIDFCFRGDWDKKAYFGAECKLLEANDKTLCDHYVSQGMQRYLDGKYSPKCPDGAMLGYVRQTACSDVANELKMRINALAEEPDFYKTDTLTPFEEHYLSRHNLAKGIFTIHHLLFFFELPN